MTRRRERATLQARSPPRGAPVILSTIRHVRGGLDSARRTGDYGAFHAAAAELRRLAARTPPGATSGIEGAAVKEARDLFAELRGVVTRGVRVDARTRQSPPVRPLEA